jgi:hypothetical protein
MRTTLPIFLSLLLLASCKGYVNTGDAVYYKSWNEGSGSQKQYLSADPRTFRDLGHGYAKDISAVYFEGARIYTADASSFEPVSEYFAHDRYSAYQGAARIHGARGSGFHNIDPYNYSTDGHDIYFDTFALHVSDVARFRLLRSDETEYWATDGQYYYYNECRIPSDDYAHLVCFPNSGGLAKDRRHVYFLDHLLNDDIDGKRVVDTIDAPSFTVTGFLSCHDKWGCFNPYHGREKCAD